MRNWMKLMMMMRMMVWMKMVTMVMNVFVHVDALFITGAFYCCYFCCCCCLLLLFHKGFFINDVTLDKNIDQP